VFGVWRMFMRWFLDSSRYRPDKTAFRQWVEYGQPTSSRSIDAQPFVLATRSRSYLPVPTAGLRRELDRSSLGVSGYVLAASPKYLVRNLLSLDEASGLPLAA
jgi:hypothetical protein